MTDNLGSDILIICLQSDDGGYTMCKKMIIAGGSVLLAVGIALCAVLLVKGDVLKLQKKEKE